MPMPARKRKRKKIQSSTRTRSRRWPRGRAPSVIMNSVLPPAPVGEIAEEQRAYARRRRRRTLRSGRPGASRARACPASERRPDRADDRHLEAVEDPHEAERDDDEPMPARPGQAVETLRDVGLDRLAVSGACVGCRRRHGCGHSPRGAAKNVGSVFSARGTGHASVVRSFAASTVVRPTGRARGRLRPVLIVWAAWLVLMCGTNLATPLYAVYRERFGFSNLVLTTIFAAYALAQWAPWPRSCALRWRSRRPPPRRCS